MPVYRLDLSYDGTDLSGYARQDGQRTVQGELENALGRILGEVPPTAVAGRTDAGVHARGQVVSFEAGGVDVRRLARSLNSMLGGEIAITACSRVPDGFNARFSATSRTYRYLASTAPYVDPTLRRHIWRFPGEVRPELLHETALHYPGEKDFSSFCRSVEGKSNIRRVERAFWESSDDGILAFWVTANAFCHQMVRSLVGLCFDVARGYIPLEDVAEIITRADRSNAGTVAPPHGLTLWEVGYPAISL
ncbi:MAG: tRNA pseudouridine(38-40) synthase TruA [Acidimicrobiia bacterium]